MKLKKPQTFINRLKATGAALLFVAVGVLQTPQVFAQAACSTTTTPATTFGQVKQSISVSTAGTYRVWSRIKAPDTTNNSYYLQIDGGCAYKVGDATSIPVNQWVWVSYQGGNTSSIINATLAVGTRNLTFTGAEPNVALDRVLFVADPNCTPTGTGDNCADSTAPTVSLAASSTSVTAGATDNLTATASDNVGVAKVEFYVNGVLKSTDTTVPYTYAWSTTGLASGTYSLTARAYDASSNTATSNTVSVAVQGSGTPTPPPPTPTPPPTPGGTLGDCAPANAPDGHVNGLDLSAVVSHDGQNYTPCDFNHDGTVGAADLAIVFGHWTW